MAEYKPRGMYFEEFQVGLEVVTQGRTMTEADLVNFSGISGDYNAIHTDAEFAKTTPIGERVAHGMLGFSVATGLLIQTGFAEGTNLAFTSINEWKFRSFVKIGDTIHATAKVTKTKAFSAAGGGFIIFQVRVLNQKSEVVQQGELTMLFRSKPA